MKCIVYQGPNTIQVEERPVPVPGENEVLLKVSHAGICGTDLNIYVGAHVRAMAPLVIGHELSGTIAKGTEEFKEGTRVTVRPLISCGECASCQSGQSHVCQTLQLYGIDDEGGMAEYMKVSKDKVHVLPDHFPLKLGALIEPLAVGVHAVRRAAFEPGMNTVVFGGGTIGLCVASVLKLMNAGQVIVVEMNPFRKEMAEQLGMITIDPTMEDVEGRIRELTNNVGADQVYDCAAHPSVTPHLTKVAKVHGKIVIVGSYKKPPEFNLLDMMFKELEAVGTRVYTADDFNSSIELLGREYPFEKLITHVLPIDKVQEGFDVLLNGGDAIKVMYQFD
ncbi:dehydrogenase [Bacillus sp. FJAT-18017]|uniref:zinc-dependent alcohol dehydrogenase n=1 Tax=Bacillus sp. FJAT-18017 TaxID=1705566 RepID=UPI0006AE5A32|nr:alcohol dehydrogenase catalytic domain-containing protein [Bacillus sp. FJAT-18017]ALC89207.1 dehydrogenase [Bacillus sp. FJAT-18017]